MRTLSIGKIGGIVLGCLVLVNAGTALTQSVDGKVKPSNLADDKWDHGSTDGEIFATIRNGVGPKFAMKAYAKEKIADADLWNVVNYIRSLGPKK